MGGSFHFGWMLSVSICAALLSQPFTNSFSSDYNALGLNKELLEAGNNVFFCVCVSINIPSIPCSLLINLGSCLLVYIYVCIYMHIYTAYLHYVSSPRLKQVLGKFAKNNYAIYRICGPGSIWLSRETRLRESAKRPLQITLSVCPYILRLI